MIHAYLVIAALALIASVQAITINTPRSNSTWNVLGGPRKVTWTSVSTDPTSFNMVLVVPNGGGAPSTQSIGSAVSTSSNEFVVDGLLPAGNGMKIRFLSVDNTAGILAESEAFVILSTTGTGAPTAQPTATSSNGATGAAGSGGAGASGTSTAKSDAIVGRGISYGMGVFVAAVVGTGFFA